MTQHRLRIAYVYDALYPHVKGGAERRYHELGRRLSDDHEVHYVSWQWWDGSADIQTDGVTLHGVGKAPPMYGRDGKRTVREVAAFSTRLVPVLLRERFDVIDCAATPYLPLYSTWLASRLTGARLVATWHEFWGEHWHEYLPHRPLVADVARQIEAASRHLGDQLVAVSPYTARRMGCSDHPRLTVVANGVAMPEIDEVPARPDAAELIYVGRLIDEKRVDLLIKAVRQLDDRFPTLRCAIVGDGPELATLRRLAADLDVTARVDFHGHVEEKALYGLIKGAIVLVLPSVREGFGMAVAEAQACGTVPVVVRSAGSGAPDLVIDHVDGVLVDPTVESVAEGVESVLADPGLTRILSENARATGMARGWDRLAARIETIYRGQTVAKFAVEGALRSAESASDGAQALQ